MKGFFPLTLSLSLSLSITFIFLLISAFFSASARGQEITVVESDESPSSSSSSSSPLNTTITTTVTDPTLPTVTNCSLVGFVPFENQDGRLFQSYQLPRLLGVNDGYESSSNNKTIFRHANAPPYAVTHVAAALLASDHFNAGDDVLVPQLGDYTRDCGVTINSLVFGDTKSSEGTAPRYLIEHLVAHGEPPCAVVGGYSDAPTGGASTVAFAMKTVLVTHGAEDARLTSPRVPEVTRTSSNTHPTGEAIVSWLRSVGRTDFLALLYTSHDHGLDHADTIENAAEEKGFEHIVLGRVGPPYVGEDPTSIRYEMETIKRSTHRTIVAVLNKPEPDQLPMIADVAEELGMNGDEYVWVFVLPIHRPLDEFVAYCGRDANTTKLVSGSAVIRALDGAVLEDSAFQKVWDRQNASTVQRLNKLLPKKHAVSDDYFQRYKPENGAGYMYDAVMAVGMGKCQEEKAKAAAAAAAETEALGGRPPPNGGGSRSRRFLSKGGRFPPPSAPRQRRRKLQKKEQLLSPHMKGITSLDFDGVTGRLVWNETSRVRNRQRTHIQYGVYNIRPIDVDLKEKMEERFPNENFTLWVYLTGILRGGSVSEEWEMTDDGPFLFGNGTPDPPKLLRLPPEQNYLSRGVRITGLALMSVSLLSTLGVAVLVRKYENKSIIFHNQPIFLYVMLAGTFFMAVSILFFSFDESSLGASVTEDEPPFLDAACTAFPWFLSLGYIMVYGALFMKLWRINRVLQTRRRRSKIEVQHVIWPCLILMGVAVILLTVWTSVDPWLWERHPVDPQYPQGETYGRCTSPHDLVFVLLLASVMLVATVLTGLMAYKTKDIDSKFSESGWAFTTIVLQFQVLLVGIPILVIVQQQSADASYLCKVLLIWTMTVSTLALMFGPKLVPILFPKFVEKWTETTVRGAIARGSVRVSGTQRGHDVPSSQSKQVGSSIRGISSTQPDVSSLGEPSSLKSAVAAPVATSDLETSDAEEPSDRNAPTTSEEVLFDSSVENDATRHGDLHGNSSANISLPSLRNVAVDNCDSYAMAMDYEAAVEQEENLK